MKIGRINFSPNVQNENAFEPTVINTTYLQREIECLKKENERLRKQAEGLLNPPEGCQIGNWCKSCQYAVYAAMKWENGGIRNEVSGCAFGACKNREANYLTFGEYVEVASEPTEEEVEKAKKELAASLANVIARKQAIVKKSPGTSGGWTVGLKVKVQNR